MYLKVEWVKWDIELNEMNILKILKLRIMMIRKNLCSYIIYDNELGDNECKWCKKFFFRY